jgi:transaldolase/transaldolase/glucose-6-phosphate isomerase
MYGRDFFDPNRIERAICHPQYYKSTHNIGYNISEVNDAAIWAICLILHLLFSVSHIVFYIKGAGMTKLHDIQKLGQSTWLNYVNRSYICSGGLRECIDMGIEGILAGAVGFEETIRNEDDYDEDIRTQMRAGMPATRIHEALIADDIQRSADLLHKIFEESEGLNGVASLEIDPALADDSDSTVATVRQMLMRIDRGNAMVEIPATLPGSEAILRLTRDGININATHVFSVSVFERVAQAYIAGLERFFKTHSVWRMTPTSVSSFSIGPIDEAVDAQLDDLGRPELKGKTAIALARVLYARYIDIFSGPRWEALAAHGARPLRPKWTDLTVRSDDLSPTAYIDALIGPGTVVALKPEEMELLMEEANVARTLLRNTDVAEEHLAKIAELNIDLERVADELQEKSLERADNQYQSLIASVIQKIIAGTPQYH